MEEVFVRFPHLGEKILLSLDSTSLIKCKKVARHWKKFMEVEKSKIRLIKRYTNCSDELLKNVLKKSGGAILMVSVLREIFRLFPRGTTQSNQYLKKWHSTPLHEAAKYGHSAAYQLIMENVTDKNPCCPYWYKGREEHGNNLTPLHLAAANGHLKMYELIFQNVKDSKPLDSMRRTPLCYAKMNNQVEMIRYIEQSRFRYKYSRSLAHADFSGAVFTCAQFQKNPI